MPGSTVRHFSDLHHYQSSIRGVAGVTLLMTKGGTLNASLTQIDLHQLWMQRGQSSVPKLAYTTLFSARSPIFFLGRRQQAPTIHNGTEFAPGEVLFFAPGSESYHRFPADTLWAAMSLTPDSLAAAGRSIMQRELRAPSATRKLRPAAPIMDRLLHLHEAAARLAATAPDVLSHPEVARAMEQELLRVMTACLASDEVVAPPGARDVRVPVMRRLERVLEENDSRPVYLAEVCAAIGVSDRTLRLRCTEELGMSPHRYLWLRRMHLARRALVQAIAGTTTVTAVAMDYGFGELGRFSVAYRRLFGETPSVTLHRPAELVPLVQAGGVRRPFALAAP